MECKNKYLRRNTQHKHNLSRNRIRVWQFNFHLTDGSSYVQIDAVLRWITLDPSVLQTETSLQYGRTLRVVSSFCQCPTYARITNLGHLLH